MARPQKEGMDYFPHDTDAVNDEKIEALRALYGNDGYAFYFIMLERIYRTADFEINVSDAETQKETFQILAKKVGVSTEIFEQMLNAALKWGCFSKKDYEKRGVITSKGIKKRAAVVLEKRRRMREKYHQEKQEVSAAETREETGAETPQRKEKKSKVKKKDSILTQIEDLRQRYSFETLKLIDEYIGILKTTRVSGKIADSVLEKVYTEMAKYPEIVVRYACHTVINNPALHSKKENYFYGILRNTKADEATERLRKYEAERTAEPKKPNPKYQRLKELVNGGSEGI